MIKKKDIIERINLDFGHEALEAFKLLQPWGRNERVLRCIIYLSKGSLNELNHVMTQAMTDNRDVMLWAEYKGLTGTEDFKRVRDFNETFEESEINFKE